MASNSKMEIEKFNGKSFELWKLKMEDLLVERDQWIAVDPGTTPTGTSADDWKKMDRKLEDERWRLGGRAFERLQYCGKSVSIC
jgi:hypothetical protein